MKVKRFKKGQLICKEDSPGNEMYIVVTGKVIVFKTVEDQQLDLAQLTSTNFFGEICLLTGDRRTATVQAIVDTEVLALTKDDLLKKMQEDPKFALTFVTTMARRLTRAHKMISNLADVKRSLELAYFGQ